MEDTGINPGWRESSGIEVPSSLIGTPAHRCAETGAKISLPSNVEEYVGM